MPSVATMMIVTKDCHLYLIEEFRLSQLVKVASFYKGLSPEHVSFIPPFCHVGRFDSCKLHNENLKVILDLMIH